METYLRPYHPSDRQLLALPVFGLEHGLRHIQQGASPIEVWSHERDGLRRYVITPRVKASTGKLFEQIDCIHEIYRTSLPPSYILLRGQPSQTSNYLLVDVGQPFPEASQQYLAVSRSDCTSFPAPSYKYPELSTEWTAEAPGAYGAGIQHVPHGLAQQSNETTGDPVNSPSPENRKRPHGSSTHSVQGSSSNALPNGQVNGTNINKKGRNKKGARPEVGQGEPWNSKPTPRNLACPFSKYDRVLYGQCIGEAFSSDTDLRERHLWKHLGWGHLTQQQYLDLRDQAVPREADEAIQWASWQRGYISRFQAFMPQRGNLNPLFNIALLPSNAPLETSLRQMQSIFYDHLGAPVHVDLPTPIEEHGNAASSPENNTAQPNRFLAAGGRAETVSDDAGEGLAGPSRRVITSSGSQQTSPHHVNSGSPPVSHAQAQAAPFTQGADAQGPQYPSSSSQPPPLISEQSPDESYRPSDDFAPGLPTPSTSSMHGRAAIDDPTIDPFLRALSQQASPTPPPRRHGANRRQNNND